LIYNGQVDMGKKNIKAALQSEPDNVAYQKFWKNITKADKMKDQAKVYYTDGDDDAIAKALELYGQCLALDELNVAYNNSILYDMACALNKVDRDEEAMAALNVTYNLADLVNKGAFGLCVWSAAINDKE